MGIRCTTAKSAIDNFFRKAMKILHDEIFEAFAKLGEECVIKAKDRPESESWYDHTSNLRNSIGYAVYEYGKNLIGSAFEPVSGGRGAQGYVESKKMVDELANKYADTYALVVVAGMSYAEYVEACENKDVLASTEIWARSQVDRRLKNAADKLQQR